MNLKILAVFNLSGILMFLSFDLNFVIIDQISDLELAVVVFSLWVRIFSWHWCYSIWLTTLMSQLPMMIMKSWFLLSSSSLIWIWWLKRLWWLDILDSMKDSDDTKVLDDTKLLAGVKFWEIQLIWKSWYPDFSWQSWKANSYLLVHLLELFDDLRAITARETVMVKNFLMIQESSRCYVLMWNSLM